MPGDIIIAYAYINEVTAVGFNTRTNLGGRFPIDTARKVDSQSHEKVEIFIATNSTVYEGNVSPSSLAYKTGQYIRVCRWEKGGTALAWAYGFNISTLAMGRFDVRYQFKKVEWHEETGRLLSN